MKKWQIWFLGPKCGHARWFTKQEKKGHIRTAPIPSWQKFPIHFSYFIYPSAQDQGETSFNISFFHSISDLLRAIFVRAKREQKKKIPDENLWGAEEENYGS